MKIGEMPQTSDISKNGYLIYSDDGIDSQKAGVDDAVSLIKNLYKKEVEAYKEEMPFEPETLNGWHTSLDLIKERSTDKDGTFVDDVNPDDRPYYYDILKPLPDPPLWGTYYDQRRHKYTPSSLSMEQFYEMYLPLIATYCPNKNYQLTPLGLICPDYFFENPGRTFTWDDFFYFFLPVTYEIRISAEDKTYWPFDPETEGLPKEEKRELPPEKAVYFHMYEYFHIPTFLYNKFPKLQNIIKATCYWYNYDAHTQGWTYHVEYPSGICFGTDRTFYLFYIKDEPEYPHNRYYTSDYTGADACNKFHSGILRTNNIYLRTHNIYELPREDLILPFELLPLETILETNPFQTEELKETFAGMFGSNTLRHPLFSFDVFAEANYDSKTDHNPPCHQNGKWYKEERHAVFTELNYYILPDSDTKIYADFYHRDDHYSEWINQNTKMVDQWGDRYLSDHPDYDLDGGIYSNPTYFNNIRYYVQGTRLANGEFVVSEYGKGLMYSHIAADSRYFLTNWLFSIFNLPNIKTLNAAAASDPVAWSSFMESLIHDYAYPQHTSMFFNEHFYLNNLIDTNDVSNLRNVITLNDRQSYFDKIVNDIMNGGRVITSMSIDGTSIVKRAVHQKTVASFEEYPKLTTSPNVHIGTWYDEVTHKTVQGIRVRNTVLQQYPGAKVVNGSIRNRVISGKSDVSDVGVDGTSVVTNTVANINFYSATKTKETHLVTDSSCAIDIDEQKVVEGPCRTTVEYMANLKPTPNNVILEDHITSERINFNKSSQPFYSSYFYQYFDYNSAVLISDAVVIFPIDCTIIMFYDDMFHKTSRVPFYPFDAHFSDYTVKKVTANVPTKLRLIKTLPADNNVRVPTSPAAVYGLGFITDIPSSSSIDPNDVKIYSKYKIKHFVNT